MASYLLYLPDTKGADPAQLDRAGLAELRADRSPEFAEYLGGPLGGHGNLAFWSVQGCSPALDTALYDWTKAPGGRFSLGILRGHRVNPADIEREPQRSGYWIACGDGQRWKTPAAHHLPHRYGLNDSGEFARVVSAQFKDYWEKSTQFAVQYFQAIGQVELLRERNPNLPIDEPLVTLKFSLEETWAFCCRALSINYRLTPELVSMLGLIDDDSLKNIVRAAIDLIHLTECKSEKKKDTVTIPVG